VWDTTSTTMEAALLLALHHLISMELHALFAKLDKSGMERNVLLLHQLRQSPQPIQRIPQIRQTLQTLQILLILLIPLILLIHQTHQDHLLLQFTSPVLLELTGIVNNYVACHAKQVVRLVLTVTHALLAVWATINKKVIHSVMRSVAMEKDTSWDVMMATLLMGMVVTVTVKYNLDISVQVVHQLLLMFAPELFLKHFNFLQAGNLVFGVKSLST
jgi:hypothetical protein